MLSFTLKNLESTKNNKFPKIKGIKKLIKALLNELYIIKDSTPKKMVKNNNDGMFILKFLTFSIFLRF